MVLGGILQIPYTTVFSSKVLISKYTSYFGIGTLCYEPDIRPWNLIKLCVDDIDVTTRLA